MLYIDTPFEVPSDHPTAPKCFKGRQSAHLMADTEQELIEYAVNVLRMKKEWLQYGGSAYAHFDLVGAKLERATNDPRVMKITPREMAIRIKEEKKKRRAGKGVVSCQNSK